MRLRRFDAKRCSWLCRRYEYRYSRDALPCIVALLCFLVPVIPKPPVEPGDCRFHGARGTPYYRCGIRGAAVGFPGYEAPYAASSELRLNC
jgi:hypothetical protein